jgi:hypothetical protein
MALTYPRTLLADDVKSEGEVKVFHALRDGLGDDWVVFHSVSWVRRDPGRGAEDGEIDFVLAHPDEGIVCLEVKGGDIECRHGEWHRPLGGAPTRVKDPFAQALDHRYALQRLIDDVPGRRARDLLIVHAVALPDVPVHSLVLAPDAPRELVVDRRDLEDVGAAIDRVLAYHRGARETRRAPGPDGIAMLRDLIAPTVAIDVPMAAAFLEEERALVELTREQSMLLARMARNPRMAIYGCAGSGKTMLAVEHAKRLAAAGRDVLFVCFNKALATHLNATERHERIEFRTFHSLCVRQAMLARLTLPTYDGDPPQAHWDDVLPDLLADAMEARGPQWDALVVDEAQDLRDHWLDALRLTLRDEEHAPIWLFLDDNQRVYGAGLSVPPGFFTWELSTNCRTTQAIHRELLKLYRGGVEPDARGPEGRAPEFHQATDQPAKVAALLDRLCGPDDVDPADVVVLSSHGPRRSVVLRELDGRLATDAGKRRGEQVVFSSIRAFKGLESPVVVLCELEDLDAETMDQQLYVALSRARNHAIVVAPSPPGP